MASLDTGDREQRDSAPKHRKLKLLIVSSVDDVGPMTNRKGSHRHNAARWPNL